MLYYFVELAVAQGTVMQLQQQIEKQHKECEYKHIIIMYTLELL